MEPGAMVWLGVGKRMEPGSCARAVLTSSGMERREVKDGNLMVTERRKVWSVKRV